LAYAYQAASTSDGLSAGVTEIGDKAEAKKKWRLCLDRGKLIKARIKELGGEIGKAGAGIVNAQRSSNAEPFLTLNGASTTLQSTGTSMRQKLPADVSLVLRRSSSINGSTLPPWDDTLAPHWNHDYQQQVGPSKQYGRRPELSPEQAAYQPRWKPMEQPNSADQPQSDIYQPSAHDVKVEQGIGANCSVVVSLELCLKHNIKWGTKVSTMQHLVMSTP
jgi:calpain-7